MSLMKEYVGQSPEKLSVELKTLIGQYNDYTNANLFLYAAATGKQIPEIALDQDDFYAIRDLLYNYSGKELHFLIETPGGSGEAAEEIVRYIRYNFETVNFIVVGEAKSAGTIIVLSGDEIYMTETASLGPIDAQTYIGRSLSSAYDYIEWVKNKKNEAEKTGTLNPFDAIMVAQITPGELVGVDNSLRFAQDLVVEWLSTYKFKNWNQTESSKKPVSNEMKKERAKKIAEDLCNRTKWRSHGRSIKIGDLQDIGLKIKSIDDDKALAEIVYRIHTVYRLIFDSSTVFKILGTVDDIITKTVLLVNTTDNSYQKSVSPVVAIKETCPNCNSEHNIYCILDNDPEIDMEMQSKDFKPYPRDDRIVCECGLKIDIIATKNDIEEKTGKKIR